MQRQSHHSDGDLRSEIEKRFSISDIKEICFDLDINYENLEGGTLNTKVISLITHCNQLNIRNSLISKLHERRPNVDWSSYHIPPSSTLSFRSNVLPLTLTNPLNIGILLLFLSTLSLTPLYFIITNNSGNTPAHSIPDQSSSIEGTGAATPTVIGSTEPSNNTFKLNAEPVRLRKGGPWTVKDFSIVLNSYLVDGDILILEWFVTTKSKDDSALPPNFTSETYIHILNDSKQLKPSSDYCTKVQNCDYVHPDSRLYFITKYNIASSDQLCRTYIVEKQFGDSRERGVWEIPLYCE